MINFLLDRPAVLAMAALVLLLVLSVPVGIIRKRRREKAGNAALPPAAQHSRFMGTGFDLAILLFGILVLGAIVLSLIDAFK